MVLSTFLQHWKIPKTNLKKVVGIESSDNFTSNAPNLRCFAIVLIHYFYPFDLNLYDSCFYTSFPSELFKNTC